jgi:hypothetical protein
MRIPAMITIVTLLAVPGLALAQAAPGQPPAVAGGWHQHAPGARLEKLHAMFAAANTSHDGRLTLPQAQAAHLTMLAAHFAEIDTKNRGYLTFNDIRAWRMDRQAQKLEQRAAALRAQD